MVYYVYTDGAHNQESKLVAAAYIIMTSKRFIACGTKVYKGYSANAAEMVAIGLAAEIVLKECILEEGEYVHFITDSQVSVDFFKGVADGTVDLNTRNEKIRLAYRLYSELAKKYPVRITHIDSHDKQWNLNNQADRMASLSLRQVVEKNAGKG